MDSVTDAFIVTVDPSDLISFDSFLRLNRANQPSNRQLIENPNNVRPSKLPPSKLKLKLKLKKMERARLTFLSLIYPVSIGSSPQTLVSSLLSLSLSLQSPHGSRVSRRTTHPQPQSIFTSTMGNCCTSDSSSGATTTVVVCDPTSSQVQKVNISSSDNRCTSKPSPPLSLFSSPVIHK